MGRRRARREVTAWHGRAEWEAVRELVVARHPDALRHIRVWAARVARLPAGVEVADVKYTHNELAFAAATINPDTDTDQKLYSDDPPPAGGGHGTVTMPACLRHRAEPFPESHLPSRPQPVGPVQAARGGRRTRSPGVGGPGSVLHSKLLCTRLCCRCGTRRPTARCPGWSCSGPGCSSA